jgi:O-antigen ligase
MPYIGISYFNLPAIQPLLLFWQCLLVMAVFPILFKGVNRFQFLVLSYAFVTLFIAYFNNTLTLGIMYSIIFLAAFPIFISYVTRDFKDLITGLYNLFLIIVVFNFVTLLIGGITFEQGSPIYLLGGKNKLQFTLLPSILIFYMYSHFKYGKLKVMPILLILISITSLFLSESSTSIIVAILALLFLIIPKKFIPSLKTSIFIYVAIFFMLVIYRIQESNFISNIVSNIFHKNTTLSGRTLIWDYTVQGIKENWFLGYGRGNNYISNRFITTPETHNGILEIMNFNGVVGLIIATIIMFVVAKRLNSCKDHLFSKTLSFFISLFMIIGLSESAFHHLWFWFFIVIAYNIPSIISEFDSTNTESIMGKRKYKIVW